MRWLNFYPVIALAVLAATTVWLERVSRQPSDPTQERSSSAADFVAEQARLVRHDPQGLAHYILTAQQMTHYSSESRTDLQSPDLVLYEAQRQVRVRADRGEILAGGERVELHQGVEVRSTDAAGGMRWLETEQLTLYPETRQASTRSPVLMRDGASVVRALAMDADYLAGTLHLAGEVRAEIASTEAPTR